MLLILWPIYLTFLTKCVIVKLLTKRKKQIMLTKMKYLFLGLALSVLSIGMLGAPASAADGWDSPDLSNIEVLSPTPEPIEPIPGENTPNTPGPGVVVDYPAPTPEPIPEITPEPTIEPTPEPEVTPSVGPDPITEEIPTPTPEPTIEPDPIVGQETPPNWVFFEDGSYRDGDGNTGCLFFHPCDTGQPDVDFVPPLWIIEACRGTFSVNYANPLACDQVNDFYPAPPAPFSPVSEFDGPNGIPSPRPAAILAKLV